MRFFLLFLLLWAAPADARVGGFLSGGAGGGSPSAPSVASIIPTPSSGTLTSGTVTFAVNFTANVTSSGGTPTMPLTTTPTQGIATCAPVTNAPTMTCTWSIGANQSSNTLSTTSSGIVLNGASLVASSGGVAANLAGAINYGFPGLIINPTGTPSVVVGVSITPSSGLLTQSGAIGAGNTATVTVKFSIAETVSATAPNVPTVTLTNGTVCPYSSGSTTFNINFGCTILAGQDTPWTGPLTLFLGTASSGAIALNGGSINNGGVPATLSGADGQTFQNVQVDTTTPYFVSASGSGSTCSYAAKCLPLAAQTKAQGALKHIWVMGGNYSGLAQCAHTTIVNGAATSVPADLCFSSADNNEIWSNYPGDVPVLNGGSTAYGNGHGILLASTGSGSAVGPANIIFNGLTVTNYGYANTDFENGLNIHLWNNSISTIFANAGPSGAPGGCFGYRNYWQGLDFSNNRCANVGGNGVTGATEAPATGGWSFSLKVDRNIFNTCLTIQTDGGCVYGGWVPAGAQAASTNCCSITNNLIINSGVYTGAGKGVYLDDFASNYTVSGNAITGTMQWCYQMHGGFNNIFTHNVCDITLMGSYNQAFNSTWAYYPYSTGGFGFNPVPQGTGNTLTNNIIYNGSTVNSPPIAMGIYDNNNGAVSLSIPSDSGNHYYTAHGVFASLCGANANVGLGGACVWNDSSPTTGVNPQFVNPSAQTMDGFQANGPVPSGWVPLVKNVGPFGRGGS